MTKKHFIALANEIAAMSNREHAASAAEVVCRVASMDNPRFDRARFLAACGL